MDYSFINLNENIKVNGVIDVRTSQLPPKNKPSIGAGALIGVALGVGALLSFFNKKTSEGESSADSEDQENLSSFEVLFCTLESIKNILRKNNSKEAKEIIFEFLNSIVSLFEKKNIKSFSEMERDVLESFVKDINFLLKRDQAMKEQE